MQGLLSGKAPTTPCHKVWVSYGESSGKPSLDYFKRQYTWTTGL